MNRFPKKIKFGLNINLNCQLMVSDLKLILIISFEYGIVLKICNCITLLAKYFIKFKKYWVPKWVSQ